VAEVLTFSKSLGGAAVALTVFLWPRWGSKPLLRAAAAALCVGLVVVFNVAAIVTVRRVDVQFTKDSRIPPPDSLYGRQDDPAGADRIELGVSYNPMSYYLTKQVAWHAFRERPWTGIGNSVFHLEAERAFREGRIHQAYRQVNAHSLLFGRLAETGVVGAVTLAAFLVVLWKSMLQTARLPGVDGRVGWALFAGVVGLLVNSINVDAMHFRFLWFAVGLTAGIDAASQRRASR
jgi:O-antigen ligase